VFVCYMLTAQDRSVRRGLHFSARFFTIGEPNVPTPWLGALSLAIPPWLGAMSSSESWDVNRHTARCTIPVSVVWQCKLVSG